MTNEKYNILKKGEVIHADLTEEEYFDIMEDYAQEFYEHNSPSPDELKIELIKGD